MFGFVLGDSENVHLRFSSKADIVIEFAEFELGFDVFPGFGKPAQVFGKERKCFGIAVRRAFFHESNQASISDAERGALEWA